MVVVHERDLPCDAGHVDAERVRDVGELPAVVAIQLVRRAGSEADVEVGSPSPSKSPQAAAARFDRVGDAAAAATSANTP